MITLHLLIEHHTKFHTILDWCKLFNISLMDADGFPRSVLKDKEVDMNYFLEGIKTCTIEVHRAK